MKTNYSKKGQAIADRLLKKPSISSGLLFSAMLLCSAGISAQTATQKAAIQKASNTDQLKALETEYATKAAQQKKAALDMADKMGWKTTQYTKNGSYAELQRLSEDGKNAVYYVTQNVAAARSTRANHLNSGGSLGLNLDGRDMTAYVWDGGHARVSHQEYDGAGGSNRVTIDDANSEGGTRLNFHAAHVTGTIMASGVDARAKGMAPQSRVRGYMWNNDVSEATAAARNGMLLSNHSYGFRSDLVPDQYFGAYIDESRAWDNIMFNAPYYLMVVAAGNDGNQNSVNAQPLDGNSSYDKLTGHSTSKNNLVVANAQDASINSDGSLSSVRINSSSSEGPTDDYRIKPDITGNGTGVYSTYHNSDSAYNSITGTSMASPNVTGTLLLLQEHYDNLNGSFMRAATLKGLALHTADDAGPVGPDAVYGWGLLNAKAAAEAISENGNGAQIEELTLNGGQTYTITVEASGNEPLMASISWTDRPGAAVSATNSNTPVLVNDLDIRVSRGGTTYEPYRLTGITTNGTGDNRVDPYERIDINNASGTYTITVTHKGSLSGGNQNFSLIVTGATSEPVVCEATVPADVNVSGISNTMATVSWSDVASATYDIRYRVQGSGASWTTLEATSESVDLTGLSPLTDYVVQVRSKCDDGATSNYSASTSFTTTDATAAGCTDGVDTFPYLKGFETTTGGDWTNSADDDIDWSRNSGGTPSRNTGPSSAAEGSNYIFVEASGNGTGYPDKQAIVTSPCFDLTNVSEATFAFKYHMYGASDMGSIALEASTDEGTSWTSIWRETGNQGNSWLQADVNLSSYVGGGVQLRFNRITGATWQADIAIDDIQLTEGTRSANLCDGVDEWSRTIAYQTGNRVVYQGSLFERTATGWQNLGPCDQTNGFVTTTSDVINPPLPGDFKLFPTSVKRGEFLFVEVDGTVFDYSIIDMQGKVVRKATSAGDILTDDLVSGLYLLKAYTQQDQIEHIVKFVVK